MTRFKVGDKVIPTESTFGLTGAVGTIVKRMCFYDWLVAFENKEGESFYEECLVHFEEEETMTKFKIGDKVVPTKSTFGVTGKVGTIEKRGDMYDWLVVFENKSREPFDEEDLVHFEEEETMIEEKKFFRGQPVVDEYGYKGVLLFDDGSGVSPLYVLSEGDSRDYHEYDEIEPSDEFTFSQVVAGLEQEYFEVGTSFQVEGRLLYVDSTPFSGYGLKEAEDGNSVSAHIGANLINATWKLVKPEQELKEITIDEIESILGHKVKIKNND